MLGVSFNCWDITSLSGTFSSTYKAFIWLHIRELWWKAPSSHQIVISVWSLFTLKALPGPMPNVTIPLIIYYNMISNVFLLPYRSLCGGKLPFLRQNDWNVYVCKLFFYDSRRFAQKLQSIFKHEHDQWLPLCCTCTTFALLLLAEAKPVILSSFVLDSSVAFVLHDWYCLMWEHCPLLILFFYTNW